MYIEPYQPTELKFAWCYRIYLRWRTHRCRPQRVLAHLKQPTLAAMLQPYGVHVLDISTDETDVLVLASLSPAETVAACASKIKGRVSKWLRERSQIDQPAKLLSGGYFACTTGQSTADAIGKYLDSQAVHHGYAERTRPPVFVKRFELTPADTEQLRAQHAATDLRFHVVLSTWRRCGVFTAPAAEATSKCWRKIQRENSIAIEKVSFVPDHVHIALRIHPSVSPASVVTVLMNAAQEFVRRDFSDLIIRAAAERLWQPSAYLGSYGELETKKISSYLRNCGKQDS